LTSGMRIHVMWSGIVTRIKLLVGRQDRFVRFFSPRGV
jgi:hypothetical protein